MTFDKGVEEENRDLRGWLADEQPLDTKIGYRTKGEIIEKLKQIIEDYEQFQQCKNRG